MARWIREYAKTFDLRKHRIDFRSGILDNPSFPVHRSTKRNKREGQKTENYFHPKRRKGADLRLLKRSLQISSHSNGLGLTP